MKILFKHRITWRTSSRRTRQHTFEYAIHFTLFIFLSAVSVMSVPFSADLMRRAREKLAAEIYWLYFVACKVFKTQLQFVAFICCMTTVFIQAHTHSS